MKWTPDQVETLRKLAKRGWPAADIGLEIGFSRNAIIGAARRNGIPLGVDRKPPRPPRPVNRPRVSQKLPAVWVPSTTAAAPARAAAPPEPCLLVDLTPTSCRWVLNDTWPHMHCGSPEANITGGVPYCRVHMRIAYPRSERRPVENSPRFQLQRITTR